MSVIHFNYRSLRNFKSTYHPPEEIRIQREINQLKIRKSPFGERKVPHISQNTQVRILEKLALKCGLPHPRYLSPDNFKARLSGWESTLQGLYKYYYATRPKEQNGLRIIDYMLDYLGVQRLEDRPLSEQIEMLRVRGPRILWDYVSKAVKRKLVERLVEESGVFHPRILTHDHFVAFEIWEISSTLVGLYGNYAAKCARLGKVIDNLLDDIGIPAFDDQPWDKQLQGLKQRDQINWDRIPKSTQLSLLKLFIKKLPPQNNILIPHLRMLTADILKRVVLEEIGTGLGGMQNYYWLKTSKNYKGTSVDYMLDQLGVEKFEDLPYETQCLCLKYDKNYDWDRVPKKTILRLLERVKEINSLPHLRFISGKDIQTTRIPEIDQPLGGLYARYGLKRKKDDPRGIVDVILDDLEIELFSKMPFVLQLKWTQPGGISGWKRVPETVISHYLKQLMFSAGVSRPEDLQRKDFTSPVAGKESGLLGLYTFLRNRWPGSQGGEKMLGWAIREYRLNLWQQISAKRYHGGGLLLSDEEKMFLIQFAQAGNSDAADHLIFFYLPLIKGGVQKALARTGMGRKTYDELLQVGRISFLQIIKNYNPSLSRFETYVYNSLPWYIFSAIIRDSGTMHRPAHYLKEKRKIEKTAHALGLKLGRTPSDTELADKLSITVEKLIQKRLLSSKEISLQHKIGEEDDYTIENTIIDDKIPSPEEKLREREFKKIIQQAIEGSKLKDKEKVVLRERWLNDRTLEETGGLMDRTKERVRQLEASAFKKIQKGPYANILKSLLED